MMRAAAIEMTVAVSGALPPPSTELYGARAPAEVVIRKYWAATKGSLPRAVKHSASDPVAFAASLRKGAMQRIAYLSQLQVMVIDSSIPGAMEVKGLTPTEKHRFMELVRDCGIRHQLIPTSPDDQFCLDLRTDPSRYAGQVLYTFAEVAGQERRDREPPDLAPTAGMMRAEEYGLRNIFLEMDGVCKVLPTGAIATEVLAARIAWVREHLGTGARIYVNLRNLPSTWDAPESTLRGVVQWLASRPPAQRITGIVLQDSIGHLLPQLFSAIVAELRAIMSTQGWGGDLLVHVHQGYGLAEACVLGALGSGANGIWCGISREGAGCGSANSLTSLCNLIKMVSARLRGVWELCACQRKLCHQKKLSASSLPPHAQPAPSACSSTSRLTLPATGTEEY